MINYDLFLEDGDLLEMVEVEMFITEGFFNRKKKIEPNISKSQAGNKVLQIMKDVISDSKYTNEFRKSIRISKIKYDFEEDTEFDAVGRYDVWAYSSKVREDDELYMEWDKMYKSFQKEVNEEMNKYGYFIDLDGDWDEGYIELNSPAIVKK